MKLIILLLVLPSILLLGARFYYRAALSRPAQIDSPQMVVIEPGVGVSEIAELLEEKGVINSALLFKVYLKVNDLGAKIEAGEYEIPPGLNLKEVVGFVQHGRFDVKLTFLEGWRREQMAAYLESGPQAEKLENVSGVEFLELTEGDEGYLFPETYWVPRNSSTEDLVGVIKKTFDEKVGQELREQSAGTALSFQDVVILASIIEREVRSDMDRPKVAGILIKRLKNGRPLEADATVQYAVANVSCGRGNLDCDAWWPKQLTRSDLDLDNPYNTRKNRGLPPGPICSPSLSSLEAVINYEESSYWFYLSDEEGDTHYSETLDEHQEKVLKYLSG